MKIVNQVMCLAAALAMLAVSGQAVAQEYGGYGCEPGNCGVNYRSLHNNADCSPRPGQPCPPAAPSADCIGAVGPHGKRYLHPAHAAALAARDHYSPDARYAYSRHGLDATRMDYWNRQQAAANHWHGNYNYWRYGTPTALVVPPTAVYETEYNWGVANTRSVPIYHQFTRGGDAVGGIMGGADYYSNTPYWPSSTSEFGIYPVRGPW